MTACPHTILVVDDEFTIAETLEEILTWEGYRVLTAANGREALEAIERERPSIVFLDFMMPVMDGLQVLQELRKNPQHRTLPVVLMTAAPGQLPRDEQLWDRLLVKPFGLDTLAKVMRQLLEPTRRAGDE